VGPDNGILIMAAKNDGILAVFEITEKKYFKTCVSPTFQGRDLFSPVAAHISKGVCAEQIGNPLKSYLEPSFTSAQVVGRLAYCEVIHEDSFGNVITNLKPEDLSRLGVQLGTMICLGKRKFPFLRTYSDVTEGALVGLIGGHGFFEIAANQQSAARVLSLEPGKRLRLNVVR
jgi:S-adenosylmethionine hydrolase